MPAHWQIASVAWHSTASSNNMLALDRYVDNPYDSIRYSPPSSFYLSIHHVEGISGSLGKKGDEDDDDAAQSAS